MKLVHLHAKFTLFSSDYNKNCLCR